MELAEEDLLLKTIMIEMVVVIENHHHHRRHQPFLLFLPRRRRCLLVFAGRYCMVQETERKTLTGRRVLSVTKSDDHPNVIKFPRLNESTSSLKI